MSYVLRDYEQVDVYTTGDSTVHIRARLLCDTVNDLPAPTDIPGFTLEAGSTAWLIGDVVCYMLDTGGAWRQQRSSDLSAIITDISQIRNEIQANENRISAAENRITALETAAADLVDRGAKNVLRMTGNSVTGYGVSCVFDNVNGTITLDGVNADKKCTGSFNVQVADPNTLDLVSGKTYHFLCAGTSDTTYGIYIYKAGASPNPQFDSYTNNELPWNPAWSTSNGFRLFVRQGTVVDNVILRPMITPAAFWRLSENFVPYSPSNAELYQLIRSYHP